MPWCVPITWNSPFAAQFSGSPFGGSVNGTAAVIPAGGTTEDLIKFWNDNNIPLGYTFSIQDGCLCVDSDGVEPPTGIKVGFGPDDPTPDDGNHTANFSEIDKNPEEPVDPEIQECLDCFEQLFGCSLLDLIPEVEIPEDIPLTKAAITAAIQNGISPVGEPEPTIASGTILGIASEINWGTGDPIPEIDIPGVAKACGPPTWGTLVVDLNLPATTQPGTASTTYQILDASAGQGQTYIVDKSTGTVLGQSYPSNAGGQGNGTPVPFDHTINFTIPSGTDPTQICMIVGAFGHAGGWGEEDCDEIGPGETIITVSPAACGPSLACLEEMFGCSLGDMLDVALPGILDIVNEEPEPVRVCGCGTVAGSGIYDGEDFTVLKTGTGCYEVSFQPPAGAGTSVVPQFTPQTPADGDDVNLTWTEISTNTYKVLATEQDDGGGTGELIDIGFSVLGICCDSAIGEAPPGGIVTIGDVTINSTLGEVTIVNNTNTPVTYTIEDDNGTQEVTVAANSTLTVPNLVGAITVGAGTIGGAVGGVKALVGVKGTPAIPPLGRSAGTGAVISYLPLETKQLCVTVTNETGEDAKIKVEREPGTDANFTAKGAEGEVVTTVKLYALSEGENVIRVVDKATSLVTAQRVITHTPVEETKR